MKQKTGQPDGLRRELVLAVAAIAVAAGFSLALAPPAATLPTLLLTAVGSAAAIALALRSSALRRRAAETQKAELRALDENCRARESGADLLTRQLQTVLDTAEEAIILLRAPHELIAANSAARRVAGVSRERAQSLQSFLFRAPAIQGIIDRCLADGHAELDQFSLLQEKNESILTARARRVPESDSVVIAISDITSLRKMENLKKNFVANVSHELRTPVQIVKGYAEMLSGADIEEEQRSWALVIEHQAVRMERIVADLLMLAKLEHDPSSWIVCERFSLASLLREAARAVRLRYPSAGSIDIECPEDLELDASAGLIEQAVFNLMANAVQHSGSKERIAVDASGDAETVSIRVRDHGAGIAPKDLAHIFERFYRADKSRGSAETAAGTPSSGGSGLGLAIVKHIAVAHGGTVRAESWANEGSLFELSIPRFKEDGAGGDRRGVERAVPPASP